jgi:cytochrome o ubiquinol oxidase subunit IV
MTGTLKAYLWGFFFCLILTLTAFWIAAKDLFTGWQFAIALFSLAFLQLLVQLVFFLHLAKEDKPRRNFHIFLFMAFILTIVFLGSLWVMYNLDYNMM